MFEQAFVEGIARTKRPWTVAASFAGQVALVGLAVLAPLIYTEGLPRAQLLGIFFAPSPPPAPPEPVRAQKAPRVAAKPFTDPVLRMPGRIPDKVALLVDPPVSPEAPTAEGGPGVPGGIGVPGASLNPVINNLLRTPVAGPPTPQVRQAPAKPREPVPVGGKVRPPVQIHDVRPVYPPLARQARISGLVRLEAIIATDGTIRNVRLVQGHPLLVQAAIDAVREWRYTPTLLNGEPVEVVLRIDVNFSLAQ